MDENGRRLHQDFPHCLDMMNMSEHLHDWVTLLDEYGKELTKTHLHMDRSLIHRQRRAMISSELGGTSHSGAQI